MLSIKKMYEKVKNKILPYAVGSALLLNTLGGCLPQTGNIYNTHKPEDNSIKVVQQIRNNTRSNKTLSSNIQQEKLNKEFNVKVLDIDMNKEGKIWIDKKNQDIKKVEKEIKKVIKNGNEYTKENISSIIEETSKDLKDKTRVTYWFDLNNNNKIDKDEVYILNPALDSKTNKGVYTLEELKNTGYKTFSNIVEDLITNKKEKSYLPGLKSSSKNQIVEKGLKNKKYRTSSKSQIPEIEKVKIDYWLVNKKIEPIQISNKKETLNSTKNSTNSNLQSIIKNLKKNIQIYGSTIYEFSNNNKNQLVNNTSNSTNQLTKDTKVISLIKTLNKLGEGLYNKPIIFPTEKGDYKGKACVLIDAIIKNNKNKTSEIYKVVCGKDIEELSDIKSKKDLYKWLTTKNFKRNYYINEIESSDSNTNKTIKTKYFTFYPAEFFNSNLKIDNEKNKPYLNFITLSIPLKKIKYDKEKIVGLIPDYFKAVEKIKYKYVKKDPEYPQKNIELTVKEEVIPTNTILNINYKNGKQILEINNIGKNTLTQQYLNERIKETNAKKFWIIKWYRNSCKNNKECLPYVNKDNYIVSGKKAYKLLRNIVDNRFINGDIEKVIETNDKYKKEYEKLKEVRKKMPVGYHTETEGEIIFIPQFNNLNNKLVILPYPLIDKLNKERSLYTIQKIGETDSPTQLSKYLETLEKIKNYNKTYNSLLKQLSKWNEKKINYEIKKTWIFDVGAALGLTAAGNPVTLPVLVPILSYNLGKLFTISDYYNDQLYITKNIKNPTSKSYIWEFIKGAVMGYGISKYIGTSLESHSTSPLTSTSSPTIPPTPPSPNPVPTPSPGY